MFWKLLSIIYFLWKRKKDYIKKESSTLYEDLVEIEKEWNRKMEDMIGRKKERESVSAFLWREAEDIQ